MKQKLKYLVLLLMIISSARAFGQTYSQLVEFGDKKEDRDYYYALEFYRKAKDIDSNSVEINWKYAEALRLYKDYPESRILLCQGIQKEDARIYPKIPFSG
ncbi:MAG: hypothetical protein R2780_15445 [Crocinitomicaceae bacterium]